MALTALGDATFGDNQTQFGAAFGRGLLARMMKDESKGARPLSLRFAQNRRKSCRSSQILVPQFASWR